MVRWRLLFLLGVVRAFDFPQAACVDHQPRDADGCCAAILQMWSGARCVTAQGTSDHFIKFLSLADAGLTGVIDADIGAAVFSDLQLFDVSNNDIVGPIPPDLFGLSSLNTLRLQKNAITGTIPALLWTRMTGLRILELWDNEFIGRIPTTIGGMTHLQVLDLSNLNLDGPIPTQIGQCQSMMQLRLLKNNFVGSIPTEIGNLDSLTDLLLPNNRLSGTIPPSLGALQRLTYLDIGNNQLSGTLPPEIGNANALRHLEAGTNRLTGSIPANYGTLSNLTMMAFNDNQLTGTIPPQIGNNGGMEYFLIDRNQISGSIPSSFSGLVNLKYFSAQSNSLVGGIGSWIAPMTLLYQMDLSANRLEGSIDAGIGRTDVNFLTLSKNMMQGTIPSALASCHHLTTLDLSSNSFTGQIPSLSSCCPAAPAPAPYVSTIHNIKLGKIPTLSCPVSNYGAWCSGGTTAAPCSDYTASYGSSGRTNCGQARGTPPWDVSTGMSAGTVVLIVFLVLAFVGGAAFLYFKQNGYSDIKGGFGISDEQL